MKEEATQLTPLHGFFIGFLIGMLYLFAVTWWQDGTPSGYCPRALPHVADSLALVTDMPECAKSLRDD